jgi:hypothetical protein
MKSYCSAVHALQILSDILDAAQTNIDDVNNGYDDKFGYYS